MTTPPRPRRPRRSRFLGTAAALLALTALSGTATAAAADDAPRDTPGTGPSLLPAPTGPHPIGTTTLHLTDESRTDIWSPDGGARELMVTVWYPARATAGERAAYMTAAESATVITRTGVDLPAGTFATMATHAFTDAPVRRTPAGSPLVVLSPGAGFGRMWLTAMAEDLASNGFIVAGVDHAYEANGVEFPGGRLLDCAACGQDRWAEATVNRAADIGHLLDELGRADGPWRGAREIDAGRIGVAGHSAGGSAAAEVLRTDDRVDAGLNLDGPYFAPALEEGVDRPLGLVTSDLPSGPPFHASQERMWPRLTGWRQWLLLAGSGHSSATDQGLLIDRLGVRDQVAPDLLENQFGTLPTDRGLDIHRDYATGFFAHHLKGREQAVVTDPAAVHPELAVRP
ncbi:alpha/beta hydrolase family protein [Nocardiopsis mangrovi]|uniref:Alpha/beta hydrolase family protein n=1 Tax=Nocardiopsis mangrovi TaxID=1179818 RepID=A0ABV9DU30_9ACTN